MSFLLIKKNLGLNNLKTRAAANAKTSVVLCCVETIMHLLLYNLHDCTFKWETCSYQQPETAEDCPGIESNSQSLEKVLWSWRHSRRARGGAVDSAITKTNSGWSKFWDHDSRNVMPYGSLTWPVTEKDVNRLERNDARMVTTWNC